MTDTPEPAPQPPRPGEYAAPQANPGAMPQMQPEYPQAVTILMLGIISVMGCFILGPVALIMGLRARKQVEASPTGYSNANLITIGWVCGLVATIGLVFSVLYVIFVVFATIATSG